MKLYVTFGQVHVHSVNGKTFDKDCVAVVEAEDYAAGRKKVLDFFGTKFFTDYPEDAWDEKDQLHWYPRGYIYVEKCSPENKFIYKIKDRFSVFIVVAFSQEDALTYTYRNEAFDVECTITKLGVVSADVYDTTDCGLVSVSEG